MPFYASKLTNVLSSRLSSWHGARIKFMARYIGSLLKLATTNGKELALALNPRVKEDSNYRRIQRFMSEFAFDFGMFGRFLLSLLPQKEGFIVVMDRTEWHFGSKPVNMLMIGFAYKGIAFPVLWNVLSKESDGAAGKEGSSSTEERKALFERFLELVPPEKIRAFVADREFISEDWLGFLTEREVPFVIRIRSSRRVALKSPGRPGLPARMFFRGPLLSVGQKRKLAGGQHFVSGQPVNVTGKRLTEKSDEFLILISSRLSGSEEPLWLYRRRWEIESLSQKFLRAAMKSRGFNLETTHVTTPERIAKLVGLLALAFVWSHLVGQERHAREPLKTKNHGYPERSLFRYGLDLLRSIMLNLTERKEQFRRCVRLLADPSKSFVVWCESNDSQPRTEADKAQVVCSSISFSSGPSCGSGGSFLPPFPPLPSVSSGSAARGWRRGFMATGGLVWGDGALDFMLLSFYIYPSPSPIANRFSVCSR